MAIGIAAACQHAPRARYAATIEKIEDEDGAHYTPGRGRTPLTRVQFRSASYGVFSILVPGIYSETDYGGIGDSVTFEGPARFPMEGALWFEQLRGYAVSARK